MASSLVVQLPSIDRRDGHSVYTNEELARAIGVSQRTLYSYLSQGLLPEGRRVGRQVLYANLHVTYGLVLRALVEGGVGLEVVKDIIGRLAPSQIQAFGAPLVALLEERHGVQEELSDATRQLTPATAALDLRDMRLDDPVALREKAGALEHWLRRFDQKLGAAFTQVRTQVLAHVQERLPLAPIDDQLTAPMAATVAALRDDIRGLTSTVRDLAIIVASQATEDPNARAAAVRAAARLRRVSEQADAEGQLR